MDKALFPSSIILPKFDPIANDSLKEKIALVRFHADPSGAK